MASIHCSRSALSVAVKVKLAHELVLTVKWCLQGAQDGGGIIHSGSRYESIIEGKHIKQPTMIA